MPRRARCHAARPFSACPRKRTVPAAGSTWPTIASDQGRLSRAVGADERNDLSLPDFERNAVERRDLRRSGRPADLQPASPSSPAPPVHTGRAQIGGDDGRIGSDLRRRALRDQPAGIETDDPVGKRHQEGHIVLDDHKRDAARASVLQQVGKSALLDRRSARPPARREATSSGSRASARAISSRRLMPCGSAPAGRARDGFDSGLAQQAHAPTPAPPPARNPASCARPRRCRAPTCRRRD